MKAQFDYSSPHKVLNHKDIRVEFAGKNLTKFGGIQLVRKFLGRLKIKEGLESGVPVKKREESFVDMSLSLRNTGKRKGLCIKWDKYLKEKEG